MSERYEEAARLDQIRTMESGEQITRLGPGATGRLGEVAEALAVRRVLLVTDPRLMATDGARFCETVLRRANVLTIPFVHVSSTPLASQGEAAAEAAWDNRCDGVVSLGGGSAIDIGKAAAFLAQGQTVQQHAHGDAKGRDLPHIAIPTTAGTGAESSCYAFFLQERGHEHTVLEGPTLVPDAAILDPLLHTSMPAGLTASTGANALADALEALVGPTATEASDADAAAAVHAIFEALPKAVADGHDLAARETMVEAAYRAGRAFAVAGLGAVDSISLVLSSIYNVGQSEANAMVLPAVLGFHAQDDACRAKFEQVAPGKDIEATVRGFLRSVGLRKRLVDVGIGWDDVYLCANAILRHPFNQRAPHRLTPDALGEVLVSAIEARA